MIRENEFERLEQFVKQLLVKYDKIHNDNKVLKGLLGEKDREMQQLRSQLESADAERGDIATRVKGLINQIEEWQAGKDEQNQESPRNDAVEVHVVDDDQRWVESPEEDQENGGAFFDVGSEEDNYHGIESDTEGDKEGDKEGGVQQNLFNVEPGTE